MTNVFNNPKYISSLLHDGLTETADGRADRDGGSCVVHVGATSLGLSAVLAVPDTHDGTLRGGRGGVGLTKQGRGGEWVRQRALAYVHTNICGVYYAL